MNISFFLFLLSFSLPFPFISIFSFYPLLARDVFSFLLLPIFLFFHFPFHFFFLTILPKLLSVALLSPSFCLHSPSFRFHQLYLYLFLLARVYRNYLYRVFKFVFYVKITHNKKYLYIFIYRYLLTIF